MPDPQPPHPKQSRLKDVAELAEVSIAAASRVLNGDQTLRISDTRRQSIVDAARVLEYTPTFAARALRSSKNSAIALVVPDVTSAIFSEVSRGVEAAAAELDLTVLLASSTNLSGGNDWIRRVVGQGRVDGLILQPSDDITEAAMNEIVKRRMPLVLMNSYSDGDVSTVTIDDQAGIEAALDHLFDLGHTQIGLLNGRDTSETAKRRLAGFHSGHTRRGLAPRPDWITEFGYTGVDGQRGMEAILGRTERPTAIVVSNVNAALGAVAELHKRGVAVPHDMSVIAFHDVWYTGSVWPPLTTVRSPLYEMGMTAVTTFVESERSSGPIHQIIVDPPPVVIVRASTARPPRNRKPSNQ